ncbi:hypothetical protein P167DRAFT_484491, partial [Morchella conica CCBAS932]
LNVEVEDHPPYSPDLNAIEHVWIAFKKKLHQQYPKIVDTQGGAHAINLRKEFARVLPLVWETILPGFFERLGESITDSIAAIIAANGFYIKY